MLLFVLFLPTVASDIVLKCVAPVDPASFRSDVFASVLSTFGSSAASILSIQPDTITGLEARHTYFPNITNVYTFQLLHITRVTALVPTADNAATMSQIVSSLAQVCTAMGVGTIAIDTTPSPRAFSVLDWLSGLPASVVITLIVGWILTALSCGACWLVLFCCGKKKSTEQKQPSIVLNPPPINPSSTNPPPFNPLFTMRLPGEFSKSVNQSDQYARPATFSGLCEVRLESSSLRPTSTRP